MTTALYRLLSVGAGLNRTSANRDLAPQSLGAQTEYVKGTHEKADL